MWVCFEGWMRWWGWGEGGVRQKRPPDESKRLVGCCLTWVGDEKATQRVVMTRWVWFWGWTRWWGGVGQKRPPEDSTFLSPPESIWTPLDSTGLQWTPVHFIHSPKITPSVDWTPVHSTPL